MCSLACAHSSPPLRSISHSNRPKLKIEDNIRFRGQAQILFPLKKTKLTKNTHKEGKRKSWNSNDIHIFLQPNYFPYQSLLLFAIVLYPRELISYWKLYRFDQWNDILRYWSIPVYRFGFTINFYIYNNKYKSLL